MAIHEDHAPARTACELTRGDRRAFHDPRDLIEGHVQLSWTASSASLTDPIIR